MLPWSGRNSGPMKSSPRSARAEWGRFRWRDTRLDRAVGISCVRGLRRAFRARSRSIAALNHPHVCTLYDVGPNYLVMELVEGETLARSCRRSAAGSRGAALRRPDCRCPGSRARARHRPSRPETRQRMIGGGASRSSTSAWRLKRHVVDRQAQDSDRGPRRVLPHWASARGRQYMAPEQAEGQPVDARSDSSPLASCSTRCCVVAARSAATHPLRDAAATIQSAPDPPRHLRNEISEGAGALILRCLEKISGGVLRLRRGAPGPISWSRAPRDRVGFARSSQRH